MAVLVLPPLLLVASLFVHWTLTGADPEVPFVWREIWLRPHVLSVTPVLGLLWASLAWREHEPRGGQSALLRRAGGAALVALLLGNAFLIATAYTVVGGLALVIFATAVPVAACEPGGPIRALGRSFALGRGNWLRVLAAWVLLEFLILCLAALTSMALLISQLPDPHDFELMLVFVQRVFAGLRWGLTMALTTVAFRRLRRSRAALDVDAWTEVFE